MPDPLNHLSGLVQAYISEDFVAQRKRLREARMRWIEQNECPSAYSVTTKDAEGNEVTFNTPFEVGQRKYEGEWHEGLKNPVVHEDPEAQRELLEGIDAILTEAALESKEKRLTVLVTDSGQQAFITGGEESQHPPIEEGEDYGSYYERVSNQYQREAGEAGNGRPVASDDGLRQSSAVDSPGIGQPDIPSGSDSGAVGPVLDSDADAMRAGDQGEPDASCDDPGYFHPGPGTASDPTDPGHSGGEHGA